MSPVIALAGVFWPNAPMPARARICRVVAASTLLALAAATGARGATHYYVSPAGLTAAPGTAAEPTTLEGARDKIRALGSVPAGGVVVYLRGGDYPRTASLTLDTRDSGDVDAPIVYRSFPGESAHIVGGPRLDPAWFTLATSATAGWSRLPVQAQGQVVVADLVAHGISSFGTLVRRGYATSAALSALELSVNGVVMDLARWPNSGQNEPLDPSASIAVVAATRGQTITPDVSGAFDAIGTGGTGNVNDGYPKYQRRGLVDGVQFYLYHCTWAEGRNRYWFVSSHSPLTDANCWPTDGPSWAIASDGRERIPPLAPLTSGATGSVYVRSQAVDGAYHGYAAIPEYVSATQFPFPGTRTLRWPAGGTVWFQGLFGNYWADDSLAGTVDAMGLVTLSAQPSYGIATGQPFFAMNLLVELDSPGEWYLDRGTGLLYLWPREELAGADILVSVLSTPLIDATGLSHVSFEDLVLEAARGLLVRIEGGTGVRIRYSTLRGSGSDAVVVSGTRNGVERSVIRDAGAGGVLLTGGSRSDLTAASNFVLDTEIVHYGRWERTYRSGVLARGCGQIVEHNDIHDNAHSAIRYTGNEHRFRYNRIHDVVKETNDAGAIYTGRDWGYRGNEISYNLFHHVESVFGGSHGVYLDDASSGMRVFGNEFYRISGQAILSGGGRDNIISNNVIVDARGAHMSDRRARRFANYVFASDGRPNSWNLLGRINVDFETYSSLVPIAYQGGVWASRYPALALVPNDWTQLQASHWLDPEGSVFSRNVHWRSKPGLVEGTLGGTGAFSTYAEIADNLEADPLFVDEAHLDLTLRRESPAFTIPGFQAIPFAEIGIRPATRRRVTVTKAGAGSGGVTSVAAGVDCGAACEAWFDDGAMVTLRATSATGVTFAGYSGACSGTADCVLQLNADAAVVATFEGTNPGVPQVSIEDANGAEGQAGTRAQTIRVRLSAPSPAPIAVDWTTAAPHP